MTTALENRIRSVNYEFRLWEGEVRTFEVRLRLPGLQLEPALESEPPAWTRLENRQCSHCPLKPAEQAHCPVARNLAGVIAEFKDRLSQQEVEVTIRTEAREYRKRVALQTGLSSLMGLIMVTSGCPIMDKLRPMVATHLPFSTVDETLFRAVSMYLLGQHLRQRRGLAPDWDLAGLAKIYEDIGRLNRCFRERLMTIEMQDANHNALVHLDCFAIFGAMGVEGGLGELEELFEAYLKGC